MEMDTKTKPRLELILVVLSCLHLKAPHLSHAAADTITATQSLSGDQTILSAGGIFELGFFKPGNLSNKYYIGLWYSEQIVSQKTIVWVANREKPITDRFTSVLKISNGNLVLVNESEIPVWSTNVPSNTASVQAVLLDSGNFVLLKSVGSTSEPLWQSFDHPTEAWLPGNKIGRNKITNQSKTLTSWKSSEDPASGLYSLEIDPYVGDSYVLLRNVSKQYWASGLWDEQSRIFSAVPEMRINSIYNFTHVTNENESYFTYTINDPKIVSRFVMSTSGQIQQWIWLEASKQWNLFWSHPRKQCLVSAVCGTFGVCTEKSLPFCNCVMGFQPKSRRDWDLKAYSDGCSRKTSLQCGNSTNSANGTRDGFLEMNSMSLPENGKSLSVWSVDECESLCLNNCSCTAYVHDSSGCSIWTEDLVDLRQLEAYDQDGRTLHIRVAASDLVYLKSGKQSLLIALASATAGLVAIASGYFLWRKTLAKGRANRRKKADNSESSVRAGRENNETELPIFGLRCILEATNNFSTDNRLGEGGFGPVYKGILLGHQEVAIKRLSKKSGQGHQEFMNELKLIARLQHTNLVRLLGFCIEKEEMILIYEYLPNRSLDKFLFDPSEQTKLEWGKRFQIIEGIAQGLLYLHKYSRLKIIHRDLKASNVLLDGAMNPKISDFGMAKIFDINQTEANTNRVAGTLGYMSPEYARYGHFSEKSDVFSFGVLLLEIVSGKRNRAFYRLEHSPTLAGWAWELWKADRAMEVIDASVRESCRPEEALRCIYVGFLCVQETPADRPKMCSVIRMLQGTETASLPLSKQPAFSTHSNSSGVGSSSQTSTGSFTNNAVTISLPQAR